MHVIVESDLPAGWGMTDRRGRHWIGVVKSTAPAAIDQYLGDRFGSELLEVELGRAPHRPDPAR